MVNITVEEGISPGHYCLINAVSQHKSHTSCADSTPSVLTSQVTAVYAVTRDIAVRRGVSRRH